MMKWLSHWHNRQSYASLLRFASESFPGVEFSLRKVSLAQRIELNAKVRELTLKNEYLTSGNLSDQLEAGMADVLVRKLYLEWAVADLSGLKIDGKPATLQRLIDSGPELLVSEMLQTIRQHLELSETARKNF